MHRVSLIALLVAAGLRADEPAAKPIPLHDYLPTLLLKVQVDTAREYSTSLESLHKLAEALADGGAIPSAQARQAERELLQSRADALQRERDHIDSFDQFQAKHQAKPERLRELEDAVLLPLQRHMRKFEEVFNGLNDLSKEFVKHDDPDSAHKLRAAVGRIVKSATIFPETRFQTLFAARWAALEKQSDRELRQLTQEKRDERRKLLSDQTEVEAKGKTPGEESRRRLASVQLEVDFAEFEAALRRYEGEPWKGAQEVGRRHAAEVRAVDGAFAQLIAGGCSERLAQLRSSWPELPPLMVEKVDLLSADREQAEHAVVGAAKSPETAAAAKAKFRRLRSLQETLRIGRRLVELAMTQRQDDMDNLRSPPAAPNDANSPLTQMLATEKSLFREKGQLLRVWIELQTTRLELEADLGVGQ